MGIFVNKTSLRFALIAGLAGMLSACAMAPYVEPKSGKTAEMLVRIVPAHGTLFYLSTYDDAQSCSGEKQMIGDSNRINVSKFILAADKLVTLRYVETQGNANCSMRFSFMAKSDHIYVLDGATKPGRCTAKLLDGTSLQQLVPVPIANRNADDNRCPGMN